MTDLFYRPMACDGTDLPAFAEAFANDGTAKSSELLGWQYLGNPTGHMFVDLALAEPSEGAPTLAAVYASLPVHVRIDGTRHLALQSLDTLTGRAFRGRGLFVRLAKSTFARASKGGAKLIYGFPNGSSAPGFFTKLGWHTLDPVPFLVRPLRARYVAERLRLRGVPNIRLARASRPRLPLGTHLEQISRFDHRVTALWGEFAAHTRVAVERDENYLNWRLVDKPHEDYRRVALFECDRMLAFVAYTTKLKHGGRIGYILELLFLPHAREAAQTLVRTALADMTGDGADVALAWALSHSPTYAPLLRNAFVPLPLRLRPIELHFGALGFDPAVASVVHERRNWYLSYLDSDTV